MNRKYVEAFLALSVPFVFLISSLGLALYIIPEHHVHADIAVFFDGEPMNIYHQANWGANGRVHFHEPVENESNENVIHVHQRGITIDDFFKTIFFSVEPNFRIYVNCPDTACRVGEDYIIQDLDKILVSSSESLEERREQFNQITDNAKFHSGSYGGEGE